MNITFNTAPMQIYTDKRQKYVTFKANEQQVVKMMKEVKEGKLAIHSHNLQTMHVLAQHFEPVKRPDLLNEAQNMTNSATGVIKKALNYVLNAIPKQ